MYKTGPLSDGNPCKSIIRGEGTTDFTVAKATINVVDVKDSSGVSKGGSANIELLYEIKRTGETVTMSARSQGQCVSAPTFPIPYWYENFDRGRRGEKPFTPEEGFLLKDWTDVGQNGVVATKTLKSTCGAAHCDQEIATFTLRERFRPEVTPPQ